MQSKHVSVTNTNVSVNKRRRGVKKPIVNQIRGTYIIPESDDHMGHLCVENSYTNVTPYCVPHLGVTPIAKPEEDNTMKDIAKLARFDNVFKISGDTIVNRNLIGSTTPVVNK